MLAPPLASRVRAVTARLALRAGDTQGAVAAASETTDMTVRVEIATALLDMPGRAAAASALLAPALGPGDDPPLAVLQIAAAAAAAEGAPGLASDLYRRAAHAAAAGDAPAGGENAERR